MPYKKYTLLGVQAKFGLTTQTHALFEEAEPLQPSDWLQTTLRMAIKVAYVSEKARSESIVMPILLEMKERNDDAFTIFSGVMLNADKQQELNGECDFILGLGKQNIELEYPVFCLVEAKHNNILEGYGQCIAQMIGARLLNENAQKTQNQMFGCVTNGDEWHFLKLVGQTVIMDNQRYYLGTLPQLLGAIQNILNIIKQ